MTGADWATLAIVLSVGGVVLGGVLLGVAWVVREHSLLWLRERDERIAALERRLTDDGADLYRLSYMGLPSSKDPEGQEGAATGSPVGGSAVLPPGWTSSSFPASWDPE